MSLTVNSFDSDSISTLFSCLSSSKSSSSSTGLESLLSDYSSLKTGSYGKLLKAYYSKTDDTNVSSTTSSSETSNLSKVKSNASSLTDATDTLLDKSANSIWNKITYTDENGNTVTGYDKDAIASAISKYVDAYNSLVDSGQDSSNTGILTQVASMVTTSSSSASTLAKAGITIGSDNHLSFDEDFLKNKADMSAVKSLFNGTGSYVYSVATKASMAKNYANNALADATGSKSYTSTGDYSISTASLINSLNTTV